MAAGDTLRAVYDQLSKEPNSLSNLDQDLPNYVQHQLPIFSLPTEWLWCASWCSDESKENAKTIEPDENYILPIGKACRVIEAEEKHEKSGESLVIITYGRGVYWSLEASKSFAGKIEILDLRTLSPIDEDQILKSVKKHGKSLIVTEEPSSASFSLGIAGFIQENCFEFLDAPVKIIGSENTPAIPLNENLEFTYLPNASKVQKAISTLLEY